MKSIISSGIWGSFQSLVKASPVVRCHAAAARTRQARFAPLRARKALFVQCMASSVPVSTGIANRIWEKAMRGSTYVVLVKLVDGRRSYPDAGAPTVLHRGESSGSEASGACGPSRLRGQSDDRSRPRAGRERPSRSGSPVTTSSMIRRRQRASVPTWTASACGQGHSMRPWAETGFSAVGVSAVPEYAGMSLERRR